ncbi:hypothetical protein LSCM1_06787 [Leishmania martiniquensis]|uniref:PAP/OAS1 substrate-binding-related domain-containing protein n=1 Tax=Leishmania martiniquensis TaxID=1580590 RepID=A0A836HN93_9TRYP|nr:hypothetical protein LSCM1_06787 [Leishmania martiniquensis]
MEVSATHSSSGNSDTKPALTSSDASVCDAVMPPLRQGVVAAANSGSKLGSPSSGLGSGSLPAMHSPRLQDPGGGGEKDRVWPPDPPHNAAGSTTATSPRTASYPSASPLTQRDSALSLRSADAPSSGALLTCVSSPQSPLMRAECLRASGNDSLDTCSLNNAGSSRAVTPQLRSREMQSLATTCTAPRLRLRRSASLPPAGSDGSHRLRTQFAYTFAAGRGGGNAALRSLPTPLGKGSEKGGVGTHCTRLTPAASPPLQHTPHSRDAARANWGDELLGGGGAQLPTRPPNSLSNVYVLNTPDRSNATPHTPAASATSSTGAVLPSSRPSRTLPGTDSSCHQEGSLTEDADNPMAVIAPAKKRKKKKSKKKKAPTAAASGAEGEDTAISAATVAGSSGGTSTPMRGSKTVNTAAPVTGSLPPPPIPMMPGGGGSFSSGMPGAFAGPGSNQGRDNSGSVSTLYSTLQQQQHFHYNHQLSGGREPFMMVSCAQGSDSAGGPAMTSYLMSGGIGGTEVGGSDYAGACARGDGGTYGQGGSAVVMPMTASNYHHHSRVSSGSGGAYGYYHSGMSDGGRGGASGMPPGHGPLGHHSMGRRLQEEQRQQQQKQYAYPPPLMLVGGDGGADSCLYQGGLGQSRHGSAPRSGGVGGPRYSSQPQQPYQQQPYYCQNLRHNPQIPFHGGGAYTNGADAKAALGGPIMATSEGSGGAEGGGRSDYAGFSNPQGQLSCGSGGSMQYNGEEAPGRVPPQMPMEEVAPPALQAHRNVSFRPPMTASSPSGVPYYSLDSAAMAPVAAAASALNNSSVSSTYATGGSRGGAPGTVRVMDSGAVLNEEARLLREEVMAADMAADAAPRSLLQFTPEVSPRLCRLIEREVLTYLTPSLACLQRRRSQLETLAGYITAALRHAGRQTGHEYGDISYYIFGSVNMRTVLPDGDNDVTVEVDGLVARESTLTPPPSPLQRLSSASLSDGGGAASDCSTKPAMLPVTTDSSTGSIDGTMQLTTTADGCPRLVAPAVLSIASGEVLSRVRDYLRSAKTPVFVDSLVMAEVRVLKLAMEGCNYDITIGQFGGVNCVRFLHEMDAAIGGQHLLKRTLLLLKAWCCYEAHILGGQAGYIGSYAATVMLISMLNTVEFLEDIDAGQTDNDGDGAGAAVTRTAGTPESLIGGDSTAEEEGRSLSLNPASSSSMVNAPARDTAAKGAMRDQAGEGLLSAATSPTGSSREDDRDSAGQSRPSPFCTTGRDAVCGPTASLHPLSPLKLFARFLKFYAYFDFDRYCVTAFGPLPLHKITSTPLDLSYLEVDAAHSKTLDGVAASNRAATDLAFLGLTPEGEAAIGHLVRRRQQPLLTVSGVKHLLDEVNRSRRAARQARHEACQPQEKRALPPTDSNTVGNPLEPRSSGTSRVQLNRAGCAAEDAGLMCPSCNTAVFPVRDMNVLDPLRWSSNMVRGVCRNHLQRIQRAFLEGLRLLDVASQKIGGGTMQPDGASVGVLASAGRAGGSAAAGGGGRKKTVAAAAKVAASPTSQWSVFSAASSSSRSWAESGANGGAGQARVQQGVMNDASIYGMPGGASEAGVGGGAELCLCPGYPAPHSQCTRCEAGVLRMLFPRTIEAIRKHSYLNCPWGREGATATALVGVPQCPGCTRPSLLCTPAIRHMCEPQLIFHPLSANGDSNTAATEGKQPKLLQPGSGRAPSSPTSAAPQWQSPSSAASPSQGKLFHSSGGRRGNAAAAEQVASELDEAFASQDVSEAARCGGPLGEAMLPVTEQLPARDSALGSATGSQPPPSSPPSVSSLQGNAYGPSTVEGMMYHQRPQMYGTSGMGNSGGGYASSYPAIPLSPTTPEETYYAMHVRSNAAGSVIGAGGTGGYAFSPPHHGNRTVGSPLQQQQNHYYAQQQQQACVRVGSMLSQTMQTGYNTSSGNGTGSTSQLTYATNQTATRPMEGGAYSGYRAHSCAPAGCQPQQYPCQHQEHHPHPGDDGTAHHITGNHLCKGAGGSMHMRHHSSDDWSTHALLMQRL